MDAIEIRSRQAAVAVVRDTARDLLAFFRRPTLLTPRAVDGRTFVIVLATIFLIDISVDILVNLLIWSGEAAGNEPPTPYPFEWSSGADVFSLLIVAPILEELQFRGWLNGRRRNLILAAVLVPPLFLLMDFGIVPWEWLTVGWYAYFALAALAGLWWWRQDPAHQPVPDWFRAHFSWIVYGSTIAFGLIHVASFSDFEWGRDLIYVLPQTIGGMMLAFTRLRLGLGAAMLHHALFNGYTGLWELGGG
jgi:hypothetical protein